jgi:lipopolysaccharide transport system permease protein
MNKQTKNIFQTIKRYHELIFFMTYREIRIRYKQTLLGISWAVVQPLIQMIVFTFVFSKLGRMSTGETPYPVFVLSGLLPWTFFAGALSRGVPIIINYPNLVTKIYFPREIFPMFAVFGLIVDFLCSYLVFLVLLFFFHVPYSTGILTSFLILILLMIFTMGVLFFAATVNVFFRDMTYATALLAQVWLFMTPVVYPLSKVPAAFRFWYDLNPMVGLVESYRSLLLSGRVADPPLLIQAAATSILVFYIGYRFLKMHEMKLADVI